MDQHQNLPDVHLRKKESVMIDYYLIMVRDEQRCHFERF